MEEPLAVFTLDGRLIFDNASWHKFCKKQDIEEVINLPAFADLMGGWHELTRATVEPSLWLEKESSFKHGLWRARAAPPPPGSHTAAGGGLLLLGEVHAPPEQDPGPREAPPFA